MRTYKKLPGRYISGLMETEHQVPQCSAHGWIFITYKWSSNKNIHKAEAVLFAEDASNLIKAANEVTVNHK